MITLEKHNEMSLAVGEMIEGLSDSDARAVLCEMIAPACELGSEKTVRIFLAQVRVYSGQPTVEQEPKERWPLRQPLRVGRDRGRWVI